MLNTDLPSWEQWQTLADADIAAWTTAQAASTALCLDATRRWFTFLAAPAGSGIAPTPSAYVTMGAAAAADLLALTLDHGLDPLFVPIQIPLERGPRYVQGMLEAVPAWLDHPRMQALATRVRIRPYGLEPRLPEPYAAARPAATRLTQQLTDLAQRTAAHPGPRLFFMVQLNPRPPSPAAAGDGSAGDMADPDQLDMLLQCASTLHQAWGRPPTRAEISQHFYHLDADEVVPPLRLVLSSQLGDLLGQVVPPLLGGTEDLYCTAIPLLSLERTTLRAILYDWLFGRQRARAADDTYRAWPAPAQARMTAWYQQHRRGVLGLGDPAPALPLWVPRVPG